MRTRPLALLLMGLNCLFLGSLSAQEPASPIEAALKRRVIDPDLPLKEVQEFTEQRVKPVPEFESVEQWEAFEKQTRQRLFDEVVLRGAAAEWAKRPTVSEELGVIEMEDYRIRKLRFQAVPGVWIPALLYEPKDLKGKVPVVLNVNGHDGKGKAADYKQTRCINQAKRGMLALNLEWVGMGQLRTPGFVHYKMNQLDLCGTSGIAVHYLSQKRGIDILLQHPNADPERVAVAGLSGGGWQTIFISSLDDRVTLANPVAGYSSFKTRARFQSDLGDSEQTPSDLSTVADYSLLTAMLAPHAALLTNNANDQCCFKAEHAQPPLVQASAPIYELYDRRASLRTHVNHDPGSHNFQQDNREQLYRMIGDHFYGGLQPVVGKFKQDALKKHNLTREEVESFLGNLAVPYEDKPHGLFAEIKDLLKTQAPDFHRADIVFQLSRHFDGQTPDTLADLAIPAGDSSVKLSEVVRLIPLKRPHFRPDYSAAEIDCADEIKTAEELNVPLHDEASDFHQLARSLAEQIPSFEAPTGEVPDSWLQNQRGELRELVSFHKWDVQALLEKEEQHDELLIRHWWLRVGGLWTVPATEFLPAAAGTHCRVLISDEGRQSLAPQVTAALAKGERVLTLDPFYFGESKISQRDFLYGLLVAAIGERNLGIQASQLAAIAEWTRNAHPATELTLAAVGPRSSLMALVASACSPESADALSFQDSFATLKEVIEKDIAVNQMPELFCFGLLDQFDIPTLIGLSGASQLTSTGNSDRQKQEWSAYLTKETNLGPESIHIE